MSGERVELLLQVATFLVLWRGFSRAYSSHYALVWLYLLLK